MKVPVRLRIAGRSGSLARSRQPPRRLKLPRTTVSEKKKNRPSRLSSALCMVHLLFLTTGRSWEGHLQTIMVPAAAAARAVAYSPEGRVTMHGFSSKKKKKRKKRCRQEFTKIVGR